MPNPSSNIRPRPDNTSAIVGDQGDVVVQAEDGAILTREFPGENTDDQIEQDVTNDEVIAEFDGVGASDRLLGAVVSQDDLSFNVLIEWTDDLGNVWYAERPTAFQGVDSDDGYTAEINGIPVRSTSGRIKVEDASSSVQHNVKVTYNFA